VLWLNMTAVLVLGLPFAVEPAETDIMKRRPRDPAAPPLSRALTARVALVSAILPAGGFGLFRWESSDGASAAVAHTMVVNVFALTLLTYLFNCLSLDRPILWRGVRRNPWVAVGVITLLGLQAVYTYAPFMNDLFHSAPLELTAWYRICAVAVISTAPSSSPSWHNGRAPRSEERGARSEERADSDAPRRPPPP
jgi:cation-transporting ATPase F